MLWNFKDIITCFWMRLVGRRLIHTRPGTFLSKVVDFSLQGGGMGCFSPLNQNCPWGQFEMHSTKTTVRRGLFEVENIFSNRNYDSMWHSDSFSAFCFFAFLVIYWKKRTLNCFLLIIYVQIRWFDVECKSERLNIHSFVKKSLLVIDLPVFVFTKALQVNNYNTNKNREL